MQNDGVHAAAICFDLHIPQSRSLKAKRAVVRPIVDGLRHRFKVSVAEVDHHDLWQRAAIGVAVIGESERHVLDVLDSIERFVAATDAEIVGIERSWLGESATLGEGW